MDQAPTTIPDIPQPIPARISPPHLSLISLTIFAGLVAGIGFVFILNRPAPPTKNVLGITDSTYQNPFEIIEAQSQTVSTNPFENLR